MHDETMRFMTVVLAFLAGFMVADEAHANSSLAGTSAGGWRPAERWRGVNLPYCLYDRAVRKDAFYWEEDFRLVKALGLALGA